MSALYLDDLRNPPNDIEWVVVRTFEEDKQRNLIPSNFTYSVHSSNPDGRRAIEELLKNLFIF
jgi:hypothetical protein